MTEAEQIQSEARERHAHDGKAPRAEALFHEAIDRRPDLTILAVWLACRVDVGMELTAAEQAEVRARLDAPPGTGL